jgi:hypothetical protein
VTSGANGKGALVRVASRWNLFCVQCAEVNICT